MWRRIQWLAVALILFVAAVFLMRTGEEAPVRPKRVEVERIPDRATHQEIERAHERRTLKVEPSLGAVEFPADPGKRDPFLLSLAPKGGKTAVVIEINAIRNSAVGEMLLGCMNHRMRAELETLEEEHDFDPLQDLDRIGLTDEGAIVSGNFASMQQALEQAGVTRYGDHGLIQSTDNGEVFGIWRGEMVMLEENEASIKAKIDQLEGRAQAVEPLIPEEMAYGEAYGFIGQDLVAKLLPPDDGLREKLLDAVDMTELHVLADQSVAVSLRVRGDDPEKMDELARTIGGALAMARVAAASEGETELAEFLEFAAVGERAEESFSIELAVPTSYLKEKLGDCAKRAETNRE